MKIAVWGTGSSAEAALWELGREHELAQVLSSEPKPGERAFGLAVVGPEQLDLSVEEIWICSMFYPEILRRLLELGASVENIRIFESRLLTPGIAVNEVDPRPIIVRMSDYGRLAELRVSVQAAVAGAPEFAHRWDFLRYALSQAPAGGLRVELGVFEGESLFFLQSLSSVPVWGLDSLEGFDADSPTLLGVKSKKAGGGFLVEDNAYFRKGRFQDVLVPLLDAEGLDVTFVHYDASDLAAARFSLEALEPHLSDDGVIVFDDFIPHPHDLDAPEFTAFREYLERTNQSMLPIARWASAVAMRVNEQQC